MAQIVWDLYRVAHSHTHAHAPENASRTFHDALLATAEDLPDKSHGYFA